MVEPLRHRQTKGAETDMLDLTPPRHVSTLPTPVGWNAQTADIGQRHGGGDNSPRAIVRTRGKNLADGRPAALRECGAGGDKSSGMVRSDLGIQVRDGFVIAGLRASAHLHFRASSLMMQNPLLLKSLEQLRQSI
jgi:hypothetical protein